MEIKYWDKEHAKIVNDEARWKVFPLFTPLEISQRVKRPIVNPKCSGLCVEFRGPRQF